MLPAHPISTMVPSTAATGIREAATARASNSSGQHGTRRRENPSHPTVVEADNGECACDNLGRQNLSDQNSADDEKHVNAGEPAAYRSAVVKGQDRMNRNGAKPINIGAITRL